MKIGIIGLGVVGSAVNYGMEKLGHDVAVHDIKLDTKLTDIVCTDICFICVPTPSNDDGSCNTTIVEKVVGELCRYKYQGIIVIKSTVKPGTTKMLSEIHHKHICFVPEFLRERCANTDFIEHHDVCIIGTLLDESFKQICEAHGHYPKQFVQVTPTEAELTKYFNNIYNAMLVTFANSFYEVCEDLGADYSSVKNAITKRDHITDIYLDCNKNFRGFGGQCLNKDLNAIVHLVKEQEIPTDFFRMILSENARYPITVFDGMRE